ncbi:4-hydroxythreonine-4-phosphate dehydrogenase PdxA [Actinomadura sp. KC06]|nr:4-hydroxythreonine-4-phosphate dehydrogenase PdxA [Actinomadura sp. KC06]
MGDPAGIGPEIVVKLIADERCDLPLVVIGDGDVLTRAAAITGLDVPIRTLTSPEDLTPGSGVAYVLPVTALPENLPWGRVDARAGRAAYEYVAKGVELALAGRVAALVTAPINKEALRLAGLAYPGHTEILAKLGGSDAYAMMMINNEIRVVLVTIHEPLRAALDRITVETERTAIRLAYDALRRAGIAAPRVAVAGLNPHAGENGLMGHEDRDVIAPAVRAARADGIDASGPWPPDTVFMRARNGEFDVVVAQYHDQGLIPVKYLGLEHGTNVTIGLPFVRTSVDHGTAFDIAGKGVADHTSLLTALRHARTLAGAR